MLKRYPCGRRERGVRLRRRKLGLERLRIWRCGSFVSPSRHLSIETLPNRHGVQVDGQRELAGNVPFQAGALTARVGQFHEGSARSAA
jgi:hypothetical protein